MSNSRAVNFLRNRASSEAIDDVAGPLDALKVALTKGSVPLSEIAAISGRPPETMLPLVQSLIDRGKASIVERSDLGGKKFLVATESKGF